MTTMPPKLRTPAISSMRRVMSSPATVPASKAILIAVWPVPVATSSTSFPGSSPHVPGILSRRPWSEWVALLTYFDALRPNTSCTASWFTLSNAP